MLRPALKQRITWLAGILACLILLAATPLLAQDLGTAARKERARKQQAPRRASRVYTNEDLKRPQILDPADQARALAAREKQNTEAAPQTAEIPGTVVKPAEIPLGDIARHYRLLKQIREQQELGQAPELAQPGVLARPTFGQPAMPVPPATPQPTKPEAPPIIVPKPPTSERARTATDQSHRVRRGDSLWRIAKEHLGRGARWTELARVNPEVKNPNQILVGQLIRLPEVPAAGEQYRVRAGDSLWKLARAEYGRGAAWSCIAAANPQVANPHIIYPGQTLAMPASCGVSQPALLSAIPFR